MTENYLSKEIVNICFQIHTQTGPGLLESAYEEMLCYELNQLNIYYERQKPIPIIYKSSKLPASFRADIMVENKVIIEIKSIERLAPIHFKQLLTYLKLTDLKLGLLVNFNELYIKDGIKRVVNKL